MRGTRIVLGLALVLCLALVGRWMLPDDSMNAPARAERLAPSGGLPGQAQLPAIGDAGPDVAPSTLADDSSAAFGTFRGRVIDAVTRDPVREFELEFHATELSRANEETPGARTFRTPDGRFEWQHVPPGDWTVTASARGYQRFELVNPQVSTGNATPELVLPLRPGHRLRGRVYDEASGTAIASAYIGFRESDAGRFEGDWRLRAHVSSAENGSFVLEGVPPGRVTLETYAQNYAPRELEVVVGDDTSRVEIGLSAGGTIAGHLTAADGATPVVGEAGLFPLDDGVGRILTTGEAGEFSFSRLAAGRYRLSGRASGGAVEREIGLASNQRLEGIVLALRAGRSIRGVVRGLRPEDLNKAFVLVRSEGGSDAYSSSVDAGGVFELHGVRPGRLQMEAHVGMHRQLSKAVEMPADADITVNFDFPPGARLSGRVTRAGEPLPGVRIEVQPGVEQPVYVQGESTSKKGTYVIEDLPPGEYTVWAHHHKSGRVQISGDTVFDIDVPPAQLSGRVLEEGGKLPVVGADLEVRSADSLDIRLHQRSDHFGQFAFLGLEPGDFMLTAYKPGYEMFRERISYGAPVADMAIRLRQNKGVEIRVREAGSDNALQQVWAIEKIGDRIGSQLQLRLDENGVGYIPGALAGSTLSLSASGYVPAVIRAWSGQRLDLHLERKNPK